MFYTGKIGIIPTGAVWLVGLLVMSTAVTLSAEPGDEGRPDKVPTFDDTGVQYREPVLPLELVALDGKPYKLDSAWKERPALIVLTSITCPVSRDNCGPVDALARKYEGQVNVVVIYTIDAHPVGSKSPYSDREWLTPRNVRDKVLEKQPATLEERIALAKKYKQFKDIKATLVVDAMDDRAWKHIGPGPNTAVLVGTHGHVSFRQGWLETGAAEGAIRWSVQSRKNAELKARAEEVTRKLILQNEYSIATALKEGDRATVDRVLKEAPELVNLPAGDGRGSDAADTALHLRYWDKNNGYVDYLLEHGADVHAINSRGRTPLHLAAEHGKNDIV